MDAAATAHHDDNIWFPSIGYSCAAHHALPANEPRLVAQQ